MSKASVQSLAILAIAAGAIKMIQKYCLVTRVDCKERLELIYVRIGVAINQWPETGNGHKNTASITKALRSWEAREYTVTDRFRTAVLLATCERALTDLHDKLNNPHCKRLVNNILEPLADVWKVYGHDGVMYSVWEESAAMVDQLQEILEWS